MTEDEKKNALYRAALEIKMPIKPWWAGDPRVEEFMQPVREAIDRNMPNGCTDIYNRAYEAVYNAIKKYDRNKIAGEK